MEEHGGGTDRRTSLPEHQGTTTAEVSSGGGWERSCQPTVLMESYRIVPGRETPQPNLGLSLLSCRRSSVSGGSSPQLRFRRFAAAAPSGPGRSRFGRGGF